MPLHLRNATLRDVPGITVVGVDAFEHDPVNLLIFPESPNPTGDRHRADRIKWRAWLTLDRMTTPGWISMVVVDDEQNGRIAGYAQWTKPAPPEGQEPDPPMVTKEEAASAPFKTEQYPPSFDKETTERGLAEAKVEEDRVLGEGGKKNVWYLAMLSVDPAYQGRGIGKMLLQWGIEQARAQGTGLYLSATPAGRPFYERIGLKDAGTCQVLGTPITSFVLPD